MRQIQSTKETNQNVMTKAGKGHEWGLSGIPAIRREFWEEDAKGNGTDEPFIPTCPHCKASMREMVTMPVVVTYTDIPRAYMLCCPSCKAVIHTITSNVEPRDDWWEEVDKNRRKEDEESSRDDLRQLLKFESVKGNEKAVIDSILDGIPKSEIRHMLVKKLSNEDHQKWEHQQIKKHFREGNQCL